MIEIEVWEFIMKIKVKINCTYPIQFVHSVHSNDLNAFWSDHTDIIYSYNYCLIRHSCIKLTIKQGDSCKYKQCICV